MLSQGSRKRVSQAGVAPASAKKARVALSRRVHHLEKLNKKQRKTRKVAEAYASGQSVTNAAPHYMALSSSRGDSPSQYVANEAFLQTGILSVRMNFPSRTTNLNNSNFRIIGGFIRHDATTLTATGICQDLFGKTNPETLDQYEWKARTNREGLGTKYIIKLDKIYTFQDGIYYDTAIPAATTMPHHKTVKLMLNLKNVRAEWDASSHGASNHPHYNCPFFLFITDNATGGTINAIYRQWFTDEACT